MNNEYVIVSTFLSLAIAQVLKVFTDSFVHKRLRLEKIKESGGMPSSHSAITTALATSLFLKNGVQSDSFVIALVIALIVMYDATGVRRETGRQSEIINKMLETNIFEFLAEDTDKKLREFIGHTPFQVFIGAILGVVTSIILYNIYMR